MILVAVVVGEVGAVDRDVLRLLIMILGSRDRLVVVIMEGQTLLGGQPVVVILVVRNRVTVGIRRRCDAFG